MILYVKAPSGDSKLLWGQQTPTVDDCGKDEYDEGDIPIFVPLGPEPTCTNQEDKVKALSEASPNRQELITFYLDNGGYDADALIQGFGIDNHMHFKSKNTAGILDLELLEMEGGTTTIIGDPLATKSISISADNGDYVHY